MVSILVNAKTAIDAILQEKVTVTQRSSGNIELQYKEGTPKADKIALFQSVLLLAGLQNIDEVKIPLTLQVNAPSPTILNGYGHDLYNKIMQNMELFGASVQSAPPLTRITLTAPVTKPVAPVVATALS